MIYLDNASTGGFKPRAVSSAVENAVRYLSANPGRSGHRLSLTGASIVNQTRSALSSLFSCPRDRVIFTKNCTEALNLAIFGTLKKGGHVITTVYEHNSVLRPLYFLESTGQITLSIVSDTPNGIEHEIEKAVCDNTYMIVLNALSNVTGKVMPIEEIGKIAKKFNLLYLVDGAQGGGHLRLDMVEQNISMLALACHKGLYGIMGSGALLIDGQTEVAPLMHGGTGSETTNHFSPACYPERLEAGTLNLPAICALSEGIDYVRKNFDSLSYHLSTATEYLIDGLRTIKGVTLYSDTNPAGIVSFSISGISSEQVADVLNTEYDVAVRGGLHCAPLMHKHLNTLENGLVRASLSVQNSSSEIGYFVKAIKEIAKNTSQT